MNDEIPLPATTDLGLDALIRHWDLNRRTAARIAGEAQMVQPLLFTGAENKPLLPTLGQAELLIGSEIVVLGGKTNEGRMIEAVAIPFIAIFDELMRDPGFLFRFDYRKMEELVAAAYKQQGYEVILTPRSGDGGRDVIAIHHDFKIRLLDQVKQHKPGHLVDANDVRALYGVLSRDPAASKGVVTTTSDFAPGVRKEFADAMPTRLELRNGKSLFELIEKLAKKRPDTKA